MRSTPTPQRTGSRRIASGRPGPSTVEDRRVGVGAAMCAAAVVPLLVPGTHRTTIAVGLAVLLAGLVTTVVGLCSGGRRRHPTPAAVTSHVRWYAPPEADRSAHRQLGGHRTGPAGMAPVRVKVHTLPIAALPPGR